MTSESADAVCIAPKGMVRLVYIDPRGHEYTVESDYPSLDAAKRSYKSMLRAHAASIVVYNDQGIDLTEAVVH